MQSKILFCKAKALDGTLKLHFFKGLVNCKKKKKKRQTIPVRGCSFGNGE